MTSTQIFVGDAWKRREPLGDPYDVVRVVGKIDGANQRPDEWTLQPAHEFGATIGSDSGGVLDHCDRISAGDADEDWS